VCAAEPAGEPLFPQLARDQGMAGAGVVNGEVGGQLRFLEDVISLKAFREARHAVVAAQGTGHGIVEAVFECAGIEPDVRVRLPHFLAVPMVIAKTDLVVTVPQRLGEAFAKILPLRLLPHPLKIPPFQVNQYWHRRFHQDPANQWLRGNFTRLFRQ